MDPVRVQQIGEHPLREGVGATVSEYYERERTSGVGEYRSVPNNPEDKYVYEDWIDDWRVGQGDARARRSGAAVGECSSQRKDRKWKLLRAGGIEELWVCIGC